MKSAKARAADALGFIENLRHFIGRWAGHPFILAKWQQAVITRIFGTLNDDGTRKIRTAYIEVPRKNGKSHLAAAVALYMLCADGESGAEVYGAGYDRDQASIVFRIASQMVRAQPELDQILDIHEATKKIIDRETGSFYQAVSRETLGAHGYNPHCIVFDEIHTQKTRELYDTLVMGMGARIQPLIFGITTAGDEHESVLCKELHDYSEKVVRGLIKDPTWYACIYGAAPNDDWTSPKVWKKANPNFGVTIFPDYLAAECKKAQRMPSFENAFRRFHLNQWLKQAVRWMPLREWDACRGPKADLNGQICYGGLDLASSIDIAALCLAFPGDPIHILPFFWVPEDTIREMGGLYAGWLRDGFIRETPGNFIDHRIIRRDINEIGRQYRIKQINFDPFNAAKLTTELAEEDGFTMAQFRQGFLSMSPPTKELMRSILGRAIAHGGHPVLRWMVDNAVTRTDPAGNIKLDRAKSAGKIDGLIALVMAMDGVQRLGSGKSVYEGRGVLTV